MIRSTFYSFETARSAITAGQYGLDTVGHNLSNMNTYGYTRQRVDQVSFVTSSSSKYAVYGRQLPGQGSMITGISQIRDTSLDVRYRQESSNWGELAIKSTYYSEMSSIFDEITTDGLDKYFEKLLQALSKMADKPTDSDLATVVRSNAEQLVKIMNLYANDLDKLEAEMLEDLELTITGSVNVILEQIGELNKQIERSQLCGQNANELMDTRNLLLDQLSELVPIQVTYTPVKVSDNVYIERLVVKVQGTSTELVNGKDFGKLELAPDSTDPSLTGRPISIRGTDANGGAIVNLQNSLTGGGLVAYVDLLDGKGNFAVPGDNDARGIQYYRAMFDELAETFADVMNGINGQPLFIADDQLPGTQITAKNITLTTAWRDDPMHLRVASGTGDLENDVLLRFVDALSPTAQHGFVINAGGQTLDTSFQKYFVTFNAELALDASTNASLFKTSNTTMNTLYDNRDSISGVSMNEEGISMMMYQNYYSAASRYLTTLDEALNLIISGMGLVGR